MKLHVIFFGVFFLISSCTTNHPTLTEEKKEYFKKIENPLERWQAHKISNYNYLIDISLFGSGAGKYRVFIQNSKVEKVLSIKSNKWIIPTYLKNYYTFNDLIIAAQSKDTTQQKIQVKYDSLYGYPIQYFDEGYNEVIDDEYRYEIREVEFFR
ncbi:MAG: DUF6174 domain-containing protein [Bacteroidota bacterium]